MLTHAKTQIAERWSWIAAVALTVATVAVIMIASLSREAMFAAENLMHVAASAFTLCMLVWILWVRCRLRVWQVDFTSPSGVQLANIVLAGFAIREVGFLANRAMWLAHRLFKAHDMLEMSRAVEYGMQWLSLVSLTLMAAGGAIALGPALRVIYGPHWPLAAYVFCITSWLIGYQMAGGR